MIRNAYHRAWVAWHRWRATAAHRQIKTARDPLDVSIIVSRMHLHVLYARRHGAKITTPNR